MRIRSALHLLIGAAYLALSNFCVVHAMAGDADAMVSPAACEMPAPSQNGGCCCGDESGAKRPADTGGLCDAAANSPAVKPADLSFATPDFEFSDLPSLPAEALAVDPRPSVEFATGPPGSVLSPASPHLARHSGRAPPVLA